MINEKIKIVLPENVIENWQEILNVLSNTGNIPAALIMRLRDDDIEVFLSSQSEGNPYHPGESSQLKDRDFIVKP